MLKIPSLIKTPSHRSFSFKTRYYDSDKEAFNERVKKARINSSDVVLSEVDSIKERVREKYQKHRNKKANFHSNVRRFRILLFTLVLAALTYWILK